MSSRFDVTLTTNYWASGRPKTFVLDADQWDIAVRLVERSGYGFNTFAGLTRGTVGPFTRVLKQALQQKVPQSADPVVLDAMVNFLQSHGAAGTTLTRSYKSVGRA